MASPPLIAQTTYAELLERCVNAAFSEDFAEDGAFTSKTIKGKRYWYFQSGAGDTRIQRYVGPETPELLERIAHHKQLRDDERERRSMVTALTRSYRFSGPIHEIGEIIAALARAGVFRLRGVLIGTVAYQTYSAMLGVRLFAAPVSTDDVDIAQFKNVSVAVGDKTPPVIDVLKAVNRTFRPIPSVADGKRATRYVAEGGLRVDFLTPNEGKDTSKPQALPALQTDAEPLRFLDYLIHAPEPAVVLHNAGIYVHVPQPARYAVHKLIVARERREGVGKRDKDLQQAAALLMALAEKRPHELKAAWQEAFERGPSWRQRLMEALGLIDAKARDALLKVIDGRRSMVSGLDLTFNNSPVHYDFTRDIATFTGESLGRPVACAISREALDDHFGTDGLDQKGRVEAVLKNRSAIEQMARAKYLAWPIEDPSNVLIKTVDVDRLAKEIATKAKPAAAKSRGPAKPRPGRKR